MSDRWIAVQRAGWCALALGIASAWLFNLATAARPEAAPTLVYPYLAAASLFATTCVWILSSASLGAQGSGSGFGSTASAKRWAKRTFVIVFCVLICTGMAGKDGSNAVHNLNWYLFQDFYARWQGDLGPIVQSVTMPFNYLAASGNALALATVVFIGVLCKGLTDAVVQQHDVLMVVEQGRRLFELLVLASALMVTSTLTLYLLFGSAEQIEALRQASVEKGAASKAAQASVPGKPDAVALTLECVQVQGTSSQQVCTVKGLRTPDAAKRQSSAAYMALVAGLAFSGALFILFMACSGAVDQRVDKLMADEKKKLGNSFSVKTWRETHGVLEAAATDRVLKALALLAPALTGALTLVAGP